LQHIDPTHRQQAGIDIGVQSGIAQVQQIDFVTPDDDGEFLEEGDDARIAYP
jgi:hypothetical protein